MYTELLFNQDHIQVLVFPMQLTKINTTHGLKINLRCRLVNIHVCAGRYRTSKQFYSLNFNQKDKCRTSVVKAYHGPKPLIGTSSWVSVSCLRHSQNYLECKHSAADARCGCINKGNTLPRGGFRYTFLPGFRILEW